MFRLPALLALLAGAQPQAVTCWDVDQDESRLGFAGIQADARFRGVFEQWRAKICFDPDDLGGSSFEVLVATSSVDTRASDRDEALRGPEFFHVEQYPEARYRTTEFRETRQGFEARGRLTLRGITGSVPLSFDFARNGDGTARLAGSARLLRLDFDVGTGEWRDTQWVADEVEVSFELKLVQPEDGGEPE